ncbi:MAG: 2-oxo acid dehydrogenase subunit E2 [Anaerolineae bacterium]|nr:2-oxo acid dehydrogenase subunit E2 [Anaerolineae bacterium]
MATEVIVPKMGQTVETVRLVQWLVKEGDQVHRGDPILEIETDKATFEVEAPASGVLRVIEHKDGEEVPVVTRVGIIAARDEDISALLSGGAKQEKVATEPEVEAPTTAAPSTAMEAPTPAERSALRRVFASPRARRRAREAGLTDLSGIQGTGPGGRIVEADVVAYLEQAARPQPAAPAAEVTPLARRVAADLGVDLSKVTGTGPGGRITREDVERAAREAAVAPTVAVPETAKVSEVVPLRGIRAVIAQRMSESYRSAVHVTEFTEVDATELVELRTRLKEDGVPVSYNDLIVYIVARVLPEHPALNSALVGEEIHYYKAIHIGVAVDTERGLLVPVIKDVDKKRLSQIAQEFASLAQAARDGRISPDDLTDSTFTITNLGMYEIDGFTPIINPPQCAVLGIGRITDKPVVREGQIVVRKMMVLSLSFDHRIVDGAPAARFLQQVKYLIEHPHLLLA